MSTKQEKGAQTEGTSVERTVITRPKEIEAITRETPYLIAVVTFLNDSASLEYRAAFAPPGILRWVTVYSHTVETNHEDVRFHIEADKARIIPFTAAAGLFWIPIPTPTLGPLRIDLNHPIAEDTELAVVINALPSNGVTFIFTFEPMELARSRTKGMIRSYEQDLAEVV